MDISELEEALSDILPVGFHIGTDKHGQVIVFTGLTADEDGELFDFDLDDEDELEFDPDAVPLIESDED